MTDAFKFHFSSKNTNVSYYRPSQEEITSYKIVRYFYT